MAWGPIRCWDPMTSAGNGHETGCISPFFKTGFGAIVWWHRQFLDEMGLENLQFQVSLHVWVFLEKLWKRDSTSFTIWWVNQGGFHAQGLWIYGNIEWYTTSPKQQAGAGISSHQNSPKTHQTHPKKSIIPIIPRFSPGCGLFPHLFTSVLGTVAGAPETPGARRLSGGHVVPPAQPKGAHSVSAPPGTTQPSAHRSTSVVSGWETAWKGWHLKDRMLGCWEMDWEVWMGRKLESEKLWGWNIGTMILEFRSEIEEVGGFGMVEFLAEENSDLRLKIDILDFRFRWF